MAQIKPSRKPLTEAEGGILAGVCRGLSNAEIADELGISDKTVKSHLWRVYKKLGVHSRSRAIVLMMNKGGKA